MPARSHLVRFQSPRAEPLANQFVERPVPGILEGRALHLPVGVGRHGDGLVRSYHREMNTQRAGAGKDVGVRLQDLVGLPEGLD